MPRRLKSNFLVAFLIVSFAVVLQLKIGLISSLYPNFTLAALIASALFLDFSELGFLVFFSALILNWRPGLSPEIMVLISLPITVSVLRRFLPAQAWMNLVLALVLGLLVFYSAAGFQSLVKNFNIFLIDLTISTVVAVPTFLILKTLNASKI
ncbi:MAG: hypothetical protein HYT13_01590 [Candidatus Liptonbacteria bacterium]|nr:hypothetical protein [Candidatus Liptonbacteria bacterium]